jgi:uncharacterized protein YjbI with pentapeptide repeats
MISPQPPPADPFVDDLIEGEVFRDLDFRGREISEKVFRDCTFTNVIFAEVRLRECRFEDCVVGLSDWTMAKVYGTATRGVGHPSRLWCRPSSHRMPQALPC